MRLMDISPVRGKVFIKSGLEIDSFMLVSILSFVRRAATLTSGITGDGFPNSLG